MSVKVVPVLVLSLACSISRTMLGHLNQLYQQSTMILVSLVVKSSLELSFRSVIVTSSVKLTLLYLLSIFNMSKQFNASGRIEKIALKDIIRWPENIRSINREAGAGGYVTLLL